MEEAVFEKVAVDLSDLLYLLNILQMNMTDDVFLENCSFVKNVSSLLNDSLLYFEITRISLNLQVSYIIAKHFWQ